MIGALQKTGLTTAMLRRRKAGRLKRQENTHKQIVRDRDVLCRFPLCPCQRFNLFCEVSHHFHKGIGGDPTGERSTPALMLLICNWRHKEARISIDKKSLRWEPVTFAGADGPIAWSVDLGVFSRGTFPVGTWVEVAREMHRGQLGPATAQAREILNILGKELEARFR